MVYFYIATLPFFFYTGLKIKKSFHMLQQNLYNENNRYGKWILKNLDRTVNLFDVFLILINICFLFVPNYICKTVWFCCYAYAFYHAWHLTKREDAKIKFKVTKRVRRLIYTTILLYGILLVCFGCFYQEANEVIYYVILALLSFFAYFVTFVVNIINYPIERMVYYYYYNKAKKKLKAMKNLKIVGITGSYGKTSCKNILSDVLNIKYNARPTPKSINTYNGLMIVINNQLDKFDDIFIAELGAYVVGEIKGLCKLVGPKYGILTKIGQAHLESFKSQENIQKGKFELIEQLPSDGVAVLNGDDELQVNYDLKNPVPVLWYGIENKNVDVRAENITYGKDGMTFDVIFKGDKKKYPFCTNLLGEANVYNVLAAITLGNYFSISKEELQRGVRKVRTIEHRLEFKNMGDFTIIDDAYNSNPIGAKMALDVLGHMPGKKIVVTPGMIELGQEEEALNQTFGEQIALVADEVLLIGEKQTKAIYQGLLNKKYKKNKIHILKDVKEAFPLLETLKEEETYVLLENDLPDIFREKE